MTTYAGPNVREGETCPNCRKGKVYIHTVLKPVEREYLICSSCGAMYVIKDLWKQVVGQL